MAEFGTLARRLPQDPMPEPQAYPTFRRGTNIEDRREQTLTPAEHMQLLMQMIEGLPGYPAPPPSPLQPIPDRAATPLSVQAGMLDVHPSHERWLAERIGAQPSSITVSNR